jgi:peptide deformylase
MEGYMEGTPEVTQENKINIQVLPIIQWKKGSTESLVLRSKCEEIPIENLTDEEKEELFATANNMIATLSSTQGALAIAANQLGITKRMFVINLGFPRVFVNPKIIEKKDEVLLTEMCLSVPYTPVKVRRYNKIKLEAYEVVPFFKYIAPKQVYEFEGIYAQAIQHEIDHLDGKLIIDYIKAKRR